MPFFKLDDLDNFELYKKSRAAALPRIGEKPLTFVYSKKHNFKLPQKKAQPLLVFEAGRIDPNLIKGIKAGGSAIAEGSCYKSKEGVLTFEVAKGDLDGFDMFPNVRVLKGSDKPDEVEQQPTAGTETPPPTVAPPKNEKPDAPEATEAEDEESQDLKVRLTNSLKKIKTANGKEILAFVACVAKPFYGILFARNATEKIGPAHKKTLTDLTQGTKFIVGGCLLEENAYTFVVEAVPGGLAKKLKEALQEFTGLACKVRVRDAESRTVADGDTDTEPDEPKPPGANAEAMARFVERLKALQPEILKASAAGSPQADKMKLHAKTAGERAKANDFAAADRELNEIDSLLKSASTSAPTTPRPPTPTPKPTPPPPKAPPPPPKATPTAPQSGTPADVKLSTYLSGRANLRSARESAEKELKRLQQLILEKAKDEPFFAEVQSKSQRLFDFLTPIDESVGEKLEEAGRCTDPEKQTELNTKIRELIQKQLAAMRGHPLASLVDKNPFGQFTVKQPIETTLTALDKQLS